MTKSARGGKFFPRYFLLVLAVAFGTASISRVSTARAQTTQAVVPAPPQTAAPAPQRVAAPGQPLVVVPKPQKDRAHALEDAFEHVSDSVGPATVLITVNMVAEPDADTSVPDGDLPLFPGEDHKVTPRILGKAFGSGVIISAEGYILTNDHVVEPARGGRVLVTLNDKSRYWGTVVRDITSDLAVVKISAGHPLPFAPLDNILPTRVGQWAIAIGSPLNDQNIVTAGIVSGIHRRQMISGDGEGATREYADLIETDAPINRGSSGGPLLNIDGAIIGINVAMLSSGGRGGGGLGFAIPVNVAKAIADQLIANGKVRRSTLGLRPASIPGHLRQKPGSEKGAYITQVLLNSPADHAGIEPGDIVTKFGTDVIDDDTSLRLAISMAPPQTAVPITLLRNGHQQTVSATLENRNEDSEDQGLLAEPAKIAAAKLHASDLGLSVHALPVTYSAFRDLSPPVRGVLVAYVTPGSAAADSDFERNCVITSVNGISVISVESFDAALATCKPNDVVTFGVFLPTP